MEIFVSQGGSQGESSSARSFGLVQRRHCWHALTCLGAVTNFGRNINSYYLKQLMCPKIDALSKAIYILNSFFDTSSAAFCGKFTVIN